MKSYNEAERYENNGRSPCVVFTTEEIDMALINRLTQGIVFIVLYAAFEQYNFLNDIFPSGLLGTIAKIGMLFFVSVIGSYAILRVLRPKREV